MSDVTFSKKGFIWSVLIVIIIAIGIGTLVYYTGYFGGEARGYHKGIEAARGILRAPEVGRIYETVVVGREIIKKDKDKDIEYYYNLPYNSKLENKYLYKGEGSFVLIEIP